MSTTTDLTRLRHLRQSIELAQARVKRFSDERDQIIADLLISRAATGDTVGEAAGVSQPRCVQVRNAVLIRRAEEAEEAAREAARAKRRARRRKVTEHTGELVVAS